MATTKKKSAKPATKAGRPSAIGKPAKSAKSIAAKQSNPPPAAAAAAKPFAELIDVGATAPAFNLPDASGTTHTLSQYAGRWIVIYFYPKDDTSGCTVEACGFRDTTADFKKRGAEVLGVSPDDEPSHARFIAKFSLPFTLLSDTEKSMCKAYGVWQEKSMYGRRYMGVARTTYLIDPKGNVAARWDKVKVNGHEREVLAMIDALTSK